MRVSVLIPCHNAERWVGAAITSALAQTHPEIEVIAHDDGSTDGTVGVLQRFGDRLRWRTGPNRGGNPTRNALLAEATGEWVQFLDADDALRPGKIAGQLATALAQPHPVDWVYSPVLERHEATGREHPTAATLTADLPERWLRWEVCQTGGVLWRTAALRALGGWNEAYPCCQDNELCLRALQAGLPWAFHPPAEAVYRLWSEGTVCRRDPARVIQTRTRLMAELLAWLKVQGRWHAGHDRAAGQACFEMARTWARDNLAAAARYAAQQQQAGRWHPAGPAAPASYRWALRLFGFSHAERLARLLRRPPAER